MKKPPAQKVAAGVAAKETAAEKAASAVKKPPAEKVAASAASAEKEPAPEKIEEEKTDNPQG